jgi:hypothetical protein
MSIEVHGTYGVSSWEAYNNAMTSIRDMDVDDFIRESPAFAEFEEEDYTG